MWYASKPSCAVLSATQRVPSGTRMSWDLGGCNEKAMCQELWIYSINQPLLAPYALVFTEAHRKRISLLDERWDEYLLLKTTPKKNRGKKCTASQCVPVRAQQWASRSHQYRPLCLKFPVFTGFQNSNATSRPQQRLFSLMRFILCE